VFTEELISFPSPLPSTSSSELYLTPTQADVSAPEIRDAYEDIRNDKTETNWLLLDYASPKEDRLVLTGTGTGVSSHCLQAIGNAVS